MARVTIEDCVGKVENNFELVALAAQRTKDISSGAPITVERNKDKDSVISLREIATGQIKVEFLREKLIRRLQTRNNNTSEDQYDYDYKTDKMDSSTEEFNYVSNNIDFCMSDAESNLDTDSLYDDDLFLDLDDKME